MISKKRVDPCAICGHTLPASGWHQLTAAGTLAVYRVHIECHNRLKRFAEDYPYRADALIQGFLDRADIPWFTRPPSNCG